MAESYRYLALGDSYTYGEGVLPEERWCSHLVSLLRKEGRPIEDPLVLAKTGWTTGDLIQAIRNEAIIQPVDMVSLLIGVNNQYQHLGLDVFAEDLSYLLTLAINFAGDKPSNVFFLSIPDWGQTPFAAGEDKDLISHEIDAYNEVARELCQKYYISFLDLTWLSKQVPADRTLLAADGLHYSSTMYLKWAEEALPLAKRILF